MKALFASFVVVSIVALFCIVGCEQQTTPPTVDQLKAEVKKADEAVTAAQKVADKAAEDLKAAGTDKVKVEAAQKVVDTATAALKTAKEAATKAAEALAKATAAAAAPAAAPVTAPTAPAGK